MRCIVCDTEFEGPRCPNCGAKAPALQKDRLCPACGLATSERWCPLCGVATLSENEEQRPAGFWDWLLRRDKSGKLQQAARGPGKDLVEAVGNLFSEIEKMHRRSDKDAKREKKRRRK